MVTTGTAGYCNIRYSDIKYFDEEVFAPMWTASKGADYFAFAWVPGERALRQLATDYSDQVRRD